MINSPYRRGWWLENKKDTDDGTVTKAAIRRLLREQNSCCAICFLPMSKFHKDHIVPLSKMGAHTIKNIQLVHADCNTRKRNYLPWFVSENRTYDMRCYGDTIDADGTFPASGGNTNAKCSTAPSHAVPWTTNGRTF